MAWNIVYAPPSINNVVTVNRGAMSISGFSPTLSNSGSSATIQPHTAPINLAGQTPIINGSGGFTSVFSVYSNHSGPSVNGQGVGWANDFSFGSGSINGSYTSNPFPGHTFSLLASAGEAWQPAANFIAGFPSGSQTNVGPIAYNLGAFQTGTPRAQDGPFTDMTFELWTATPGDTIFLTWNDMGFFSQGFADTTAATGLEIFDLSKVPGVATFVGSSWQKVTVPLAFSGQLGKLGAYKFSPKNNAGNAMQFDNVGFVQGTYSWIFNGGAPNGFDNGSTVTAGAFVTGHNYVIKTAGTTSFTAVGAANNSVGTQFFATGPGTGTGTVTGNSWIFDAQTPVNGWADASVNASANYAFPPSTISALGTSGGNFSANGHLTPGYGVGLSASFSGTTMTATNVNGILQTNMIVQNSAGGAFPIIVSQLTGPTGGNGTYQVSPSMGTTGTAAAAAFASTTCAQISNTATNGMWKVTQTSFSLSAMNRFTFGVLPTNGTHSWKVQFYDTSGVATGSAVTIASGSLTYTWNDNSTGGWTVYVIPLSAFGSLPSNIGGVSIQDQSSVGSNVWNISAVAFTS